MAALPVTNSLSVAQLHLIRPLTRSVCALALPVLPTAVSGHARCYECPGQAQGECYVYPSESARVLSEFPARTSSLRTTFKFVGCRADRLLPKRLPAFCADSLCCG
eukprot:307628-Pleurochrysis_carterae.AAC.2